MKAIISSTYDDKYLYFIPIVTWCWNKLGVDVICFMPYSGYEVFGKDDDGDSFLYDTDKRIQLIISTISNNNLQLRIKKFTAPQHKQATYAQCSRLYGACLDLPEEEILITGDVDMAMFKVPPYENGFTIYGSDLVPDNQYPMCYISAKVKDWRNTFCGDRTYQQCLDDLVGIIECDHFRGNQWSLDQSEAYNRMTFPNVITLIKRARPQTQFADNRVDRDDINWRAYVNDSLVDAHLWRPGFQKGNFEQIMELLQMMYPNDNFDWLVQYNEEYKKLL